MTSTADDAGDTAHGSGAVQSGSRWDQLSERDSHELNSAERADLRAHQLLRSKRFGAAHYAFCETRDEYLAIGCQETASEVDELLERLRQVYFPVYGDDTELLEDVRTWIRGRLSRLHSDARAQPAAEQELGDRAAPRFEGGNARPRSAADDAAEHAMAELRHRWLLRLDSNRTEGQPLQILTFVERLRLSPEDLFWLLTLVAIEGDAEIQRTRRRLINDDDFYSVGLVLQVITDFEADQQLFLDRLEARRPLVRLRVVHLARPASRLGTGLANHLIELDEAVIAHIWNRNHRPQEVQLVTKLYHAEQRPGQKYFSSKLTKLDKAAHPPGGGGVFVVLCATTLETNRSLALTWATRHGLPLIEFSCELAMETIRQFDDFFWRVLREALIRQAVLFIRSSRTWNTQPNTAECLRIVGEAGKYMRKPVLLDAPPDGEELLRRILHPVFEVRTLPPTLTEQVVIWRDAIEHANLEPISDEVLRNSVCDMALNVEDIHRAVRLAVHNTYLTHDHPCRSLDPRSLRSMATSKLNQGMYAIADRVATTLTWNDIILPTEVLKQLNDIITYARYQREVYEEWGFGAKMPYGRANSSLFSGPPGTGKTMVAGIIAHELGMDLFRIETSRVVSKYIGETEKNLAKVFDEAARSHAIILFDEADSLFTQRAKVKDSRDRYSNLEINYLLQRIETFDGITILTTNFRDNIDAAFARRIKFKVHFPHPSACDRAGLWKLITSGAARVSSDVDFERLGRAFDFTGAYIKDTVLRAAFRAAEAGIVINHELLEEVGIDVAREQGSLIRVREGRVDLPPSKMSTAN